MSDDKKHAVCSASSSNMWLHCPPSARRNAEVKDGSSTYAEEGSQAHQLCEHKLKKLLGRPSRNPAKKLSYYTTEMEQGANEYVNFISEQIEAAKETCPDPYVFVEQKVDFSDYVEGGFGTADCIIIGELTLRIIDFKFGAGTAVSSEGEDGEGNSQLMLYALGALSQYDALFDIETVSMSIVQPRRDNISTFEMPVDDLYRWADTVLKPAAELAYKGDGRICLRRVVQVLPGQSGVQSESPNTPPNWQNWTSKSRRCLRTLRSNTSLNG